MKTKPKPGSPFENNPLFLEVLAEGLAIQDRFYVEPVYSKTGTGYLKSVGVSEIERVKALQKKTTNNHHDDRQDAMVAGISMEIRRRSK